jgi:voltage-gated potassium channel
VRVGIALLSAVGAVGVLWFWLVEGWSLVDAAYQTTTTITTVGFGEVREFDDSAKLFSIALMVVGVATALFTLGAVFGEQVEHQLQRFGRRRMDRRIESLRGHMIVCGFGRVGSQVAKALGGRETKVVVVDEDPERAAAAAESGYLTVVGDSTEDETLVLAGINEASVLMVSLADDADAISTVLSARVLNGELRIIARANAASAEAKLMRAGCNHVVNPLHQGAQRIAAFAQQPAVADFLDVVIHDGSLEYRLEEIVLPATSPLAGIALGAAHLRAKTGALVLALRTPDGAFVSNPSADEPLRGGSTLIAIGTEEQLAALVRELAPQPDIDRAST